MLNSITFPQSTTGENPLKFPPPGERGSVTVLCGPNGSGKSFILRAVAGIIDGKKAGFLKSMTGWNVERSGETIIEAFKPQHHSSQMNSIGTLSIEQGTKQPQHNDAPLRLKVQLFGALLKSVEGLPKATRDHLSSITLDQWTADPQARGVILSQIESDEERVFWTSAASHEIFEHYEQMTGVRIGLRRAVATFELVAAYRDGSAADYGNWSDGQKSLFSIVSSVILTQPDVYIFDEIENYLHPAYMSSALEFLKSKVPQTIPATHHPHLIFGKSVDEVYYVERQLPQNPRYATSLQKQLSQEAPRREITRLANNHAKLASAYRLFDLKDSALLASAATVSNGVDQSVYSAMYALFECHAIDAQPTSFPDRQTKEVADLVLSYGVKASTVLDWGAGLGRVRKEAKKLSAGHPVNKARWVLYDPSYTEESLFAPDDSFVEAVANRTSLEGVTVEVGLLTNVLHVLPLNAWVEALQDLWQATQGSANGLILITEIFPLLSPERNAVPVPRFLLEAFCKDLGFNVYGRDFDVHGAKSYCLALTRNRNPVPASAALQRKVVELWRSIEAHLLSQFEAAPAVDSPAVRNELMNAAFGIASIRSRLSRL